MNSVLATATSTLLFLSFSSVLKLTPMQLHERASYVVIGTPVSRQSELRDNERFFTLVTIEVDTVIKGYGPRRCVVSIPGGAAGSHGQEASEVPPLNVGQRYILYMVESGPSTYSIVGSHQGVMPVHEG